MSETLLDRIVLDPEVMLGKPVVRGTRITVEIILEKLAAGLSFEEILDDFPGLERSDILAVLSYAHRAISTDEVILRVPRAS